MSQIAFDAGQKAVLTSCVLINQAALSRKRKKHDKHDKHGKERDKNKIREDAKINCCFSFTIRRDSYAIPSVGQRRRRADVCWRVRELMR